MPKIKKQKRRKVYRFSVNRKRLRDKINKLPAIPCEQIKKTWDKGKSVAINLSNMGLASNSNEALKIPNIKALMQPNDPDAVSVKPKKVRPKHQDVAVALETEAKLPRARTFKFPTGQVEWLTYLIKRYKKDFKAMSRDPRNVNQETAKQIRAKIKKFLASQC